VSIEHIKRYTTAGMATDQGKTSNMNALAIVADGSRATAAGRGSYYVPDAVHASELRRARRL
jgi:sarcosine oxidase subunit alpha